ncbi:unnamed protein product [Bemisia tabaci]|uniref:Uncharacterized protein n=1 Tax=Bemisia tabaci TaxID=7038 RepID=A0A9P0ACM4_BEMTA|nr:unnamed protein product [Bemisia tabaci]
MRALAAEAADRLQSKVTYMMLTAFGLFTQDAKVASLINTGYISSVEQGTAWWVLTARNVEKPVDLATGDSAGKISASFHEYTPSDALLCAIVQRQNSGLEDNCDSLLKWTFGEVENIPTIRSAYNLQAWQEQ